MGRDVALLMTCRTRLVLVDIALLVPVPPAQQVLMSTVMIQVIALMA